MMQPVKDLLDRRQLQHGYEPFTRDSETVKNLNADPNDDEWLVGGLVLPTASEFASFPRIALEPALRTLQLPERVDNSKQKFWRGIFSQRHGSCAQASAIAYVYTYEVNRLRNKSADSPETRYPTHWTYNFVNNGYDRGSWMMWGWDVGKAMGIPSVKAYGTETGYDLRYWPSEYAVYEDAFDNKVDTYFVMQVDTPKGLENLKRYLHDHGTTGEQGGILSFAAGWSSGYKEVKLPDGAYEAGKKMIASFGKVVNHAITFVGYDDKICYDTNNDGQCTNNIDLNGDNKIDLRDWEMGALLMANSWGTGWGNGGFIYVPYRLLAYAPADGGIYRGSVYGVVPRKDSDRGMAIRVQMQHDRRNQLRFLSAYQYIDNAEAKYFNYYGLQNSGGAYPLNGRNNEPVTFGFDLRDLMTGAQTERISQIGFILDSLGGVGTINQMEVIDYADGKLVVSDDKDVSIDRGRNSATAYWQDEDPDPEPEPDACSVGPVALAGPDLVLNEYCVQEIDGSESFDMDGEVVAYRWTQRGGKKLDLENADTAKVKVYIPKINGAQQYYWLMLTVTDDSGMSASDTVRLRVIKR